MNNLRIRHVAGAAAAVLLALTSTGARAALQSPLSGAHVPAVTRLLTPLGRPNPGDHLRLAISLPMRDQQAWNTLLQQLYDPASPNYRHFLTPAQLTGQYGPAEADYQAVQAFALAHGLTVVRTHSNRLIVDLDGAVSNVESAFHITIQTYLHPTENRTFYAPTTEPTMDLATPILRITGLDDYVKPKPHIHKSALGLAPRTGSGQLGTYLGNDFRPAYVPGVVLKGEGQSVALYELDGYYASDITAYEGLSGLPSVTLTNVLIDGFNGLPFSAGQDEVTLDIDMAIAMAPGLSQVVVYEATNGLAGPVLDELNQIATDDLAAQISCSWGLEDNAAYDQVYQVYAAQGQSFFQAAGDSGAYVPFDNYYDSDSPYTILVGGTTLTTSGPAGSYVSETVWNWFSTGEGEAAGGGGISPTYPLPTWQQGVANAQNLASALNRNAPDVALTADNIFIIAENGLAEPGVGGTSCAAPLWAGFTALVNEKGSLNGEPSLGFFCPTIYNLGKSANYESLFHDVTTGNNTNLTSGPLDYPAVVGYDLASGWGSPTPALIDTLAPTLSLPVLKVVNNVITGGNGNGRIDPNECDEMTIVITNAGVLKATGVEAVLTSLSYPGISVANSTISFPDMPARSSATATVPFTISASPSFPCGSPAKFTVTLKSDQATFTNELSLPTGSVGAVQTFSYSPASPVAIPINSPIPFYAPVQVSGVESIAKVTVSTYMTALVDSGITLQLVSPNGTIVMLASGDGAVGANFGTACGIGTETTFDDQAALPIGFGAPPFVGSYQPVQPLSVFQLMNGANVNGTWQLLVSDLAPGDTAALSCWSLNITPYACDAGPGTCPGADLSISLAAAPPVIMANSNYTCVIAVSNSGPSVATSVVVGLTNSIGTGFSLATNVTQGAFTFAGGGATWNLGDLDVGGVATATVRLLPTIPGTVSTTGATVGSAVSDPNLINNTAAASVQVVAPGADLALTMFAHPNPALEDGRLTFTLVVTNNGPFSADSVVVTAQIPNANYVSGSTTQGTINPGGGSISLGSIPPNAGATINLVVVPVTVGAVVANASVTLSPLETDPIPGNNSASFTALVNASADLGVSAVVNPVSVVSGANITYTVTYTNRGPSTTTGVSLSQSFPVGCTFVGTSLATNLFQTNATSLTLPLGSLAAGAGGSYTVTLKTPSVSSAGGTQLPSTITILGQPGDPNLIDNSVTVTATSANPFLQIIPAGATLLSGGVGINPGDTVTVGLLLQNVGNVPTTSLNATLLAGGGVTSPNPGASVLYGNGVLAPGGIASNAFTFTAVGSNGGTVTAQLAVSDGLYSLGTITYTFALSDVLTFWNPNAISIPEQSDIPVPAQGPASPYPSSIVVSNVSGLVSGVSIIVSNLSHTFPHDISMLLVSPTGLKSILMSGAGLGSGMTNITLIFSQSAATNVPATGLISPGSYRPADYLGTETFPAGAPAGPYTADLSVFAGQASAINGVWSLYINDNDPGDAGTNNNGWAIAVKTITPVNQVADLGVSVSVPTNQVYINSSNTFFVTVTNAGPNPAVAIVSNTLPSGLAFVSASMSSGSYTVSGQTVVYNLGSLQPGATANFSTVVQEIALGLQSDIFTVAPSLSAIYDPVTANNSATAVTTVSAPPADVVALITPPTGTVVAGFPQTYTAIVSNAGPQLAKTVTGTFKLAGLSFASVTASQGTASAAGGFVNCSFGDLAAGNIATAQIAVSPLATGLLTNTWTVASASADPNTANNTISAVVNVANPTPIISAGPAILLTPGLYYSLGSNQQVTMSLSLVNSGYVATSNLMAALQASGGITPITVTQSYGAIAPGSTNAQSFTFTAGGSPGATVTLTLALTDGAAAFSPVSYSFMLPNNLTFSNSAAIIIPEYGPALPYPSSITVSGVAGLLSKVTATLHGFTHTFPRDVNAMLSGPNGQKVMLLAHVGGPYSVTNLTLTFDDAATNSLPLTALATGSFQGTEFSPYTTLPGFATPVANTALSVFNGSNPNGQWTLYVDDDTVGNGGSINQGWSLDFGLVTPINPIAHLGLTMSHYSSEVFAGNLVSYTITVTNAGPYSAVATVVTASFPAGAVVVGANPSQGVVVSISNGVAVCNLGTLAASATATVVVTAVPTGAGTLGNNATVSTTSADPTAPAIAPAINSLTVVGLSPAIWGVSASSGSLQLTLTAQPGQRYTIQTSPDMIQWTSVSTAQAGLNGIITLTDTVSKSGNHFYRALHAPQ